MKPYTAKAAAIAGAYVAFAGIYIVVSGVIARALAGSVEELERLERFKGIAFVVVTGLGLFGVAGAALRRQFLDAEGAARARETLLKSERTALAGLFVSSIAHDAANIAVVVGSALDLLEGEPALGADQREAVQDAQQAMRGLNTLFHDLKEMGRNRDVSKRVRGELREMVERVVGLLHGHSALKHCRVTIDAPDPVTLPVYPVLIDQVLINLLLNAADATGGSGRLEVRVRSTGEEVRLEVHDDGKGLPEGMEKELFKPFATTKPHGTGLGLVSVRECALAHGGRVEYARSPLGGAAFSVCLPVADAGPLPSQG